MDVGGVLNLSSHGSCGPRRAYEGGTSGSVCMGGASTQNETHVSAHRTGGLAGGELGSWLTARIQACVTSMTAPRASGGEWLRAAGTGSQRTSGAGGCGAKACSDAGDPHSRQAMLAMDPGRDKGPSAAGGADAGRVQCAWGLGRRGGGQGDRSSCRRPGVGLS